MKKIKRFLSIVCFISTGLPFCFITGSNAYSQEIQKIMSIQAYDMMNTVPNTFLIDVRTRAEYQYVGHPANAFHFPYMNTGDKLVKNSERYEYKASRNKSFLDEISKVFKKTDNLLILSRDGVTSALAAKELLNAGYKNIFDIKDGFEGAEFPTYDDEDQNKFYRQLAKRNKIEGYMHRRHSGWQWWGLPWTYEIDPKYAYPPDLKPSNK
jgi:rhodanese-related sulfurtransferase